MVKILCNIFLTTGELVKMLCKTVKMSFQIVCKQNGVGQNHPPPSIPPLRSGALMKQSSVNIDFSSENLREHVKKILAFLAGRSS